MKEFIRNAKFVWNYTKEEKPRFILYTLLSIFSVAAKIVFPFISARLIVHLTSNELKQFVLISLVILLLESVFDLLWYVRSRLYQRIFRTTYLNIQTNLSREVLKLNNKTLEKNGSGKFIERLNSDTRHISTIFTDINQYANNILGNIGIIGTYFVLSKKIFVFVMIAFTVRFLLEIRRINIFNKNDKELRDIADKMTGFTSEIIRGAEDIKMLNGEESFLKELAKKFKHLNQKKFIMFTTDMGYNLIRALWSNVSYFILLVLIARSISDGSMTIPIGVVIFNFGNKYNDLVHNITNIHQVIKQFNLSASRIFDIFVDEKYEKEKFGTKHLDNVEGNFEFKNVSFKYDKNFVLKDLSFKIKANETVAFVGKSGSGKTTIFNLLCKMYDNYKGSISIDGVDIQELDKDSIRANITIVSQNPYIFNMSIKDNLKLVKENLTNKEMKEACKMACIHDFIETLPNKYDTVVGEGGIMLSGGQKQRLAIARAFVQKTEIILFDEATSALDNETQANIQKAIENLQKDYTILIVAHRLSTIKNADRILVLDEGKIIAEGKHNQLLKKCKQYKELYENELTKDEDKKN